MCLTVLMKMFLLSAAEAIGEIGILARMPVPSENRLLITEKAATHILTLAAQIALDVSENRI